MKRIALPMIVAALGLLCTGASADDKQEKILKAIEGGSGSIVKIEFECAQTDGKGSNEFSTTGIVVDEKLIMVTNVNEIDPPVGGRYKKPESFVVNFDKESKAKARFLGKDEELNLALLELVEEEEEEKKEGEKEKETKKPEVVPLPFTQTEILDLAQEVLLLNRLGKTKDYLPTFRLMRVTAVIPKPAGPTEYQLDGSLSGWTGCPVFTLEGKAVGFVGLTSVEPSGGGGRSVSFGGRTFFVGGRGRRGSPRILCTGDFKEFLADPSKFRRRKSWLGVRGFQPLNEDLAEQLGIEEGGIILGEILKMSPADKSGLLTGDVVVKIDGEKLDISEDKDLEKFTKKIERADGGTKFTFTVMRNDGSSYAEKEIRVTIEEEPVREFEVEETEENIFGLRVKPLTRDFLDRERLPLTTQGVRVTYVESAGFAYLAGVRRGDIIDSVVLFKTPDVAEFMKQMKSCIAERTDEVCFSVTRGGKSLFLCVRPEWGLEEGEEEDE